MSPKKPYPLPEPDRRVRPAVAVRLPITGYEVAEWNPSPDGTAPPEQVHLIFYLGNDLPPLVARLKSAEETDRLIALLTRHRLNVWPREES